MVSAVGSRSIVEALFTYFRCSTTLSHWILSIKFDFQIINGLEKNRFKWEKNNNKRKTTTFACEQNAYHNICIIIDLRFSDFLFIQKKTILKWEKNEVNNFWIYSSAQFVHFKHLWTIFKKNTKLKMNSVNNVNVLNVFVFNIENMMILNIILLVCFGFIMIIILFSWSLGWTKERQWWRDWCSFPKSAKK